MKFNNLFVYFKSKIGKCNNIISSCNDNDDDDNKIKDFSIYSEIDISNSDEILERNKDQDKESFDSLSVNVNYNNKIKNDYSEYSIYRDDNYAIFDIEEIKIYYKGNPIFKHDSDVFVLKKHKTDADTIKDNISIVNDILDLYDY